MDRPVRSRTRPRFDPLDILYYGIAAISLLGGAFVIGLPGLEPQLRWTFGGVLILIGVYRIVHTRMRAKQKMWEEEFERLREERAKDRPTEL